MSRLLTHGGWAAALLAAFAAPTSAAEPPPKPTKEGIEFFEKKIRPVLAKNCYSCHAGSVQARGGLRTDTRVGLLIGGQTGPAVVPGNVKKSKLIAVLKYEGPEMPPADQLPAEVIADFVKWIEMGAPDPRGEETEYKPKKKIDYEAERKQWAYQTPKKPPVPEDKSGWATGDVDRLVHAKHGASGVTPVADADGLVWLRRVSFDLVGLPPTAEHFAAIEKDASQKTREKIVDELLASKAFGERWGRHWLDVARFAESTGKERNFPYPVAWKYRDWVIDAVNADKPYDQFVREQVAGDLLPAQTSAEKDANVVATGFLALGPKGLNERNRESYLLDIADEQIENVGRTVMGLSVACARCHDHKFDPVSMADYYALAGIFRSTEAKSGIQNRTRNAGQPNWLSVLPSKAASYEDLVSKELLAEIKVLEKEARTKIDDLRRTRESASAEVLAAVSAASAVGPQNFSFAPQVLPNGDIIPAREVDTESEPESKTPPKPGSYEDIRAKQRALGQVNRKLDVLKLKLARETAHATAIAVADLPDPKDTAIRLRGEADNQGPVVPRGFPKIVSLANPPKVNEKESGRRELADWLTRPDHPLTARVAVNRIWVKLFGVGIVPTPDDFGDQGQKPTNPELLDYLAVKFVEDGWSLKKTLRNLVLTRTYQLSGADDANNLAKDEANVSLWRFNRRRLDGEALRDTVLAASGRLDTNRPTGSPVIDLGVLELSPVTDYTPVDKESRHRSVYLPVLRNKLPEALAVFDMPDPSLVVGTRDATTSPGQALYLLNSPFVLEQSGHLAKRLLEDEKLDDAGRVDAAFRAVLARKPTAAERDRVLKYVKAAGDDRLAAWTRFAQTLVVLPEFRFLF